MFNQQMNDVFFKDHFYIDKYILKLLEKNKEKKLAQHYF